MVTIPSRGWFMTLFYHVLPTFYVPIIPASLAFLPSATSPSGAILRRLNLVHHAANARDFLPTCSRRKPQEKRGTAQDLPVLNAGNFQEWSIITTNNHPSNPQQPIHSLLSTSKKRIFRTDIKLETFTGGQRVWSLQPLAQFSNGCQMLENN